MWREGRIITEMDVKGMGYEGVHWIKLIQDRVQWWAVVVILISFRVT
jgi:hypothetical protein